MGRGEQPMPPTNCTAYRAVCRAGGAAIRTVATAEERTQGRGLIVGAKPAVATRPPALRVEAYESVLRVRRQTNQAERWAERPSPRSP